MARSPDQELDELRGDVDRIDRSMVELLAERLRVVREIARIKRSAAAGQPAIRPGREAVILRRLVEQAGDRFPTGTLVRMWRELLAATTRVQAPLAIAACVPPELPELWDLARDHFGATVPIRRTASWTVGLALVADGEADLVVLPLPGEGQAWWVSLLDRSGRPCAWSRDSRSALPGLSSTAPVPWWSARSPLSPRAPMPACWPWRRPPMSLRTACSMRWTCRSWLRAL